MATEILMPKQGNTVESCLILEWRKQEGDEIKTGDVICEVETDKATFEVETEYEGTLLKVFFEEGADVPVLTPIAVVGQPGEDISGFMPKQEAPKATEEKPAAVEVTAEKPVMSQTIPPSATVPTASGIVGISPRARNLAAAKGVNLAGLTGTGPEGRIIERDILAVLTDREPLTPAAIAALVEQGMNAPAAGSGIGGRVTTADLLAAQPAEVASSAQAEFPGPVTVIPVKGVRKVIATRMHESLQTTAQLTHNASADASKLLEYRKRLKASPEELGLSKITINDLVLYAVAKTLPRFKFINAHCLGDTIEEFDRVHLGVAVDTARGLMVPSIKSADLMSLKEISTEAKRLISACNEGKILPDELSGGTFTVTNLGALGVESFTPVLNAPEVGILGVCTIQPKPVLTDGEVKFIPHIGLSLTFDHRAVDGAPAARVLQGIASAIENFDLLLAG